MSLSEERFRIPSQWNKRLLALLLLGILLFLAGILSHGAGTHQQTESAAHGHEATLFTQVIASLWLNNVFFTGLGLIGVLFVAIHYASRAGWSTLIKRVPEAFGYWLPFAGVIMVAIFLVGHHDLFHWTHASLYEPTLADGSPNPEYDPILDGKKSFLNVPFYLIRMVFFFVVWFILFLALRRTSLREDLKGATTTHYWNRSVHISAVFIIFFLLSSAVASWDWVMSIDAHWFSTMFGWYMFASWWVAGLALITYLVICLKDAGYLKSVNENHFHDLGKYVFAFSIFWAYIWFSQFMLIYYANIPEETIYFVERLEGEYRWLFFVNLFVNFFFPFLLLMTRDAKRHTQFLRIVCPVVILGHWLDFVLMINPGVLKHSSPNIFLEVGALFVFLSLFLIVVLRAMSRSSLIAQHDPMLEESIHHHT